MKNIALLPCCYLPPTIFCVDDDAGFLANLILALGGERNCQAFTDPRQALAVLSTKQQLPNWFSACLEKFSQPELEEQGIVEQTSYFDLTKFYQVIKDSSRFTEPSIIIVDYDMPEMTGLEFCRQVKNPYIKKIMLTGAADHQIAVAAFNEGVIDKFIIKASSDMPENLNEAVNELQWNYFQVITKSILNILPSQVVACLSKPIFIEFVKALFKKTKGCEFYLIDTAGSFLLLDFNGNPFWLVITTDEAIATYCEIAIDHDASPELIADLKTRNKTLFFPREADRKLNVSEWKRFTHDVKPLPGMAGFFYALVDGKSQNVIFDNINSYRSYLTKEKHK
jgi:CheY-like chemotaxis protein